MTPSEAMNIMLGYSMTLVHPKHRGEMPGRTVMRQPPEVRMALSKLRSDDAVLRAPFLDRIRIWCTP